MSVGERLIDHSHFPTFRAKNGHWKERIYNGHKRVIVHLDSAFATSSDIVNTATMPRVNEYWRQDAARSSISVGAVEGSRCRDGGQSESGTLGSTSSLRRTHHHVKGEDDSYITQLVR